MDAEDTLDIETVINSSIKYTTTTDEPCYGSLMDFVGMVAGCLCIPFSCGQCCKPYIVVNKGYKGVVTRFGTVSRITNDGLHFVNPVSESLNFVDIRLHCKQLSNCSITTKDHLSIIINGSIYYRINASYVDVINAKFGIDNVETAVQEIAYSSLNIVFGKYSLQDCLEDKNAIVDEMTTVLKSHIRKWGIIIEIVQVTDIGIPQHVKELLSTSANKRMIQELL